MGPTVLSSFCWNVLGFQLRGDRSQAVAIALQRLNHADGFQFVGVGNQRFAVRCKIVPERQLPEKLALGPHVAHCGRCSFADLVPFELCEDGQHLEDHLAGRRRRVDLFGQAHQAGPGLRQALADVDCVLRRSSQLAERIDDQSALFQTGSSADNHERACTPIWPYLKEVLIRWRNLARILQLL